MLTYIVVGVAAWFALCFIVARTRTGKLIRAKDDYERDLDRRTLSDNRRIREEAFTEIEEGHKRHLARQDAGRRPRSGEPPLFNPQKKTAIRVRVVSPQDFPSSESRGDGNAGVPWTLRLVGFEGWMQPLAHRGAMTIFPKATAVDQDGGTWTLSHPEACRDIFACDQDAWEAHVGPPMTDEEFYGSGND